MSKTSVLSTRVLMICAAVGVGIGIVSAPWVGIHGILGSTLYPIYGIAIGFHVLPGVIAQQVLRLPWVALVTHGIAALVGTAFAPAMAGRYLMVAVLFGGVQELVSAATRYRHWEAWRFLLSAAISGAVLAIPMGIVFNTEKYDPSLRIVFIVVMILAPVLWTVVGLLIGGALRRAGVAPQKVQKTS